MKSKGYISVLLLMLCTFLDLHAQDNWKLIWSDEFNTDGPLDSCIWNYEEGYVRNEESQWYQADNAVCEGGYLVIEARKEQNRRNPLYVAGSNDWRKKRQFVEYSSSSVNTAGKKEFLYGRFEVCARIPVAKGAWPAIWTLGSGMEWPSCGEIDIMEYYQIKGVPHILANAAWGTDKQWSAKWNSKAVPYTHFTDKDPDWASKFHIWRMDWDEDAIKLYLDDELLNEIPLESTVNGSIGKGTNPFTKPQYLLLNLAIGGMNGGMIDESALPMKYEIDYVRVYQKEKGILSGKVWRDTDGNVINAHGGGVLYHEGTYYWFGEHRPESGFVTEKGINCYSSTDLLNWKYEDVALPVSETEGSDIEKGCIMERPKVIYNKKTGKFVMWFHLELKGHGYEPARAAVAVSDSPTGPYRFIRSARVNSGIYPLNMTKKEKRIKWNFLEYEEWWTPEWYDAIEKGMFVKRDLEEGQMSRDMTLFVDDDGKAYHIYSSEDNLTLQIAELTDDYLDHSGRYIRIFPGGHNEAPAIFKKDGKYWMITSGCTGWEPNKARLLTATSILGEWKQLPNPCVGKDSNITFGGQSTYILPLPETNQFIFMADIWRPKSLEDSRYIWLPIQFKEDGTPFIEWVDRWNPNAQENIFTVQQPDYQKSPNTGMTRRHWIQAGEYLLKGAFDYIHTLDDQMYFPKQLDKTYPRNPGEVPVAKLEGLARTLFVAAPLLKDNPGLEMNGIKVADYYRHQLINISNPKSQSYIPHRKGGPSQTLLELGSLAISMKAAQEVLWNPLTKEQKDSLAATMLSYGEGPTINSNWMFFNVFILSFLKDQGYAVNESYLESNLKKLLERYRGEGWYNDAPAYDYYSAWAYQTYGPIWAEMFGKKQYPQYAEQFLKNQHDMVDNYPFMFSRDGRMNMWGRSICYRFAATAPLSLYEYDESGNVNYGWMRRIASSTLLQFLENPEFLEDGVPTMGFYGPFAPAVQIYSCRGSVYWCGKAFLSLLLPENSKYWLATENNGPWENDLKKGKVYNKFQQGTHLLITNYPNCGGSEMRSWCHETVAKDWQKFRSTENYNKLAYHTEFPWMADGKNGEISMNYGTKNKKGEWEVLRLYTFKGFENGIYRRDAVLETDSTVKYQLADITLPDGILRVDKVSVSEPTEICLGHYSLPRLDKDIQEIHRKVNQQDVPVLCNGEYELAMIPLAGWNKIYTVRPEGVHPVSEKCALIMASDKLTGSKIYVTLQLWKKNGGKNSLTKKELNPVESIDISDDKKLVTVRLASKEIKTIVFE